MLALIWISVYATDGVEYGEKAKWNIEKTPFKRTRQKAPIAENSYPNDDLASFLMLYWGGIPRRGGKIGNKTGVECGETLSSSIVECGERLRI